MSEKRRGERPELQRDNFSDGELVFALVAPIGLDYVQVAENLRSQLSEFNYGAKVIRLSSQIEPLCQLLKAPCKIDKSSELRRIKSHIEAANSLCRAFNKRCSETDRNAVLALAAASVIGSARSEDGSTAEKQPLLRTAHVLATLKRPEEIRHLRRIYGVGLHVIGIFATEEERMRYLVRQRHLSERQAQELIDTDEDDKKDGGQRTGDAFHLADVFVDVGGNDVWKREIGRYLDVIFSHPYKTPTQDEQAMFMAYSASLRSAQFGRQVGAAIANDNGDVIAIGCNEVPKPHGGQYWYKDVPDERDHEKGCDSNDQEKSAILDQILSTLPKRLQTSDSLRAKMRKTSLFSITEFGSATHAEMEAILSCARRGVSTKDQILFTTTFPCHNCARHIINAGIKRVVYIEPYPKSKASALHNDAIDLGGESRLGNGTNKIPFVPFVGIAPRKYAEIFTVEPMYGKTIKRKPDDGSGMAINWERSGGILRSAMLPISYLQREQLSASKLANAVLSKKKARQAMLEGSKGDGGRTAEKRRRDEKEPRASAA
jgi:deoxycytidylate deaminase